MPKKVGTESTTRKRQKTSHTNEASSLSGGKSESPTGKLSTAEQRKRAAEWAEKQGYKKATPDKKRRISVEPVGGQDDMIRENELHRVEVEPVAVEEKQTAAENEQSNYSEILPPNSLEVPTHDLRTCKDVDSSSVAEAAYWPAYQETTSVNFGQSKIPSPLKPLPQAPIRKLSVSDLLNNPPEPVPMPSEAEAVEQVIVEETVTEAVREQNAEANVPIVTTPLPSDIEKETTTEDHMMGSASSAALPRWWPSGDTLRQAVRMAMLGTSCAGFYCDFELGLGALFVAVTLGLFRRLIARLRQ